MQYYDEVQEVNERRKRRILAYYEYIDARTRDQQLFPFCDKIFKIFLMTNCYSLK